MAWSKKLGESLRLSFLRHPEEKHSGSVSIGEVQGHPVHGVYSVSLQALITLSLPSPAVLWRGWLAYLLSSKVILHQGAHDLLGGLGSAEMGNNWAAQYPLSISDPTWREKEKQKDGEKEHMRSAPSASSCLVTETVTPGQAKIPPLHCPYS